VDVINVVEGHQVSVSTKDKQVVLIDSGEVAVARLWDLLESRTSCLRLLIALVVK
jgi:hypothetical protein